MPQSASRKGAFRLSDQEIRLGITLHFFDEADFGTYDEVAESYLILLERYLLPAAAEGLKTLVVHLIEGPVVTISGVKNYVYEKSSTNISRV